MNLSPVSAMHSAYNMPDAQKPAPAAQKASSPIEDTVTLSPAAQKAVSGDVDHDGDSH